MSYTAPLNKKEIEKQLTIFKFFISIAFILFLVLIVLSSYTNLLDSCKLWAFGSFITLFSVIESKYFDIIKKSNPQNRIFSLANTANSKFEKELKICLLVEKICQYSWIFGVIILIISKWINY